MLHRAAAATLAGMVEPQSLLLVITLVFLLAGFVKGLVGRPKRPMASIAPNWVEAKGSLTSPQA